MAKRRTQRRFVITGLAALLAAPAFLIQPAAAAIAFTCDSVTGSAVFAPGLVHDTRAQSLSSGPTAPAGPAELTLASTNDAGIKADQGALRASLSADGTLVAFESNSTNLDPRATSIFTGDIYVKNLITGDLTLVSTSDAEVKGNRGSSDPALSADGTRVAFFSSATNLDPADTDPAGDVYVKDLTTGDITLASTSDAGVKGNSDSYLSSLSSDGTRVAFYSRATNLDPADTDAAMDVYVKNLNSGSIDLVSRSDTGVKGNRDSAPARLSADGRTVVFQSRSTNLDPGDADDFYDIYVKNRVTGDITLASTSDTGVKGNEDSSVGPMSADLTKVAFYSRANNLDPRDVGNFVSDVYVKNLITGDLALASTSDTGVKGDNNSVLYAISADGTKVGFASVALNLDPNNVNTDRDTYVKDLATGDLTMASASGNGVASNSTSGGVVGASASADLSKVAFESNATNLDPADTDNRYDVYVKAMPSVPTSVEIGGCSNGNSGTASIVDIRSYGPRPLGCPVSLGGTAGNDYADTTPILVGATLSMTIDWAMGPNSYGVAAAKAGPTGTQWRFRLAITASSGHDTPATNQYLPAAGSGFTKTRLQGKFDVSALDSFNCTSGVDDPLSWLSLANNGTWVAKTS